MISVLSIVLILKVILNIHKSNKELRESYKQSKERLNRHSHTKGVINRGKEWDI
jgi:hypothetical protein